MMPYCEVLNFQIFLHKCQPTRKPEVLKNCVAFILYKHGNIQCNLFKYMISFNNRYPTFFNNTAGSTSSTIPLNFVHLYLQKDNNTHPQSIFEDVFHMYLRNKHFLESHLPHEIPLGLYSNLHSWRVHLHTTLIVRLLQITHDTSFDDIFKTAFLLNGTPTTNIHPPPPHPGTHINSPT